MTISNLLDVRAIECARMAEALDALRCAVVLTDARGGILHANRYAEDMLRQGEPIFSRDGMLHARAPGFGEELRTAIQIAATEEAAIGKAGLAIRLTDPDRLPTFAHVLPIAAGELRTRLHASAVAAVFIGAPPDAQGGALMMAAAYNLTRTETRVLASLLAGQTLAETAAALGVAGATVKTHLDCIFSKTGLSRQADLIRVGAALAPPTDGSHHAG